MTFVETMVVEHKNLKYLVIPFRDQVCQNFTTDDGGAPKALLLKLNKLLAIDDS